MIIIFNTSGNGNVNKNILTLSTVNTLSTVQNNLDDNFEASNVIKKKKKIFTAENIKALLCKNQT